MSESFAYQPAGVTARDRTHTLFAQTLGYVALTAGLFALGAGPVPTWYLLVTARCRGWRRHRHTAVVTEASNNLQLGPLRPNILRLDDHV